MHMAATSRRLTQSMLIGAVATIALLILHPLHPFFRNAPGSVLPSAPLDVQKEFDAQGNLSAVCPGSKIQEDVLVVLRTGATQSQRRIPTHLNTILQCVPHFAIFSDVAQKIGSIQVHDALEDLGDTFRNDAEESDFYHRLQDFKEQERPWEELLPDTSVVKEDTQAWKLDKWKFIPMVEKAVQMKPDASWYVFIEDDMYLVWSNLLQFLEHLPADDALYLGGQNWMGGIEFGNGGAGIILSGMAAHMFARKVQDGRLHYEQLVLDDCCGDSIIAKVFKDLDISLTRAWPILQGETPSTLDFSTNHWCRPVATYHHMSNTEITRYWTFEQLWLKSSTAGDPILHRDAFEYFVEPLINSTRHQWNNLSKDKIFDQSSAAEEESDTDKQAHLSIDACGASCKLSDRCLQYSYDGEKCKHGYVTRLGHQSESGITSGWMFDKVMAFKADQEPCEPSWDL